jgi:hypothetical protein
MNNTDKQKHIPSRDEIFHYLEGFEQEGGEKWQEENEAYLRAHNYRFFPNL